MSFLLFDIGANQGGYSKDMLSKIPDCNVVCVEPNPKLLRELQLNLPESVIIYNKAASSEEGQLEFFECSEDNTISTVSKDFLENSCFSKNEKIMLDGRTFCDHYHYNKPILVDTITLDWLIENHGSPDLIKIDVEGYELEVLKSLSKKVGKITFEWHETFLSRIIESVQHLSNIGYKHFGTHFWNSSSDYHDGEIGDSDYKSIDDFIKQFSSSLLDNPKDPNIVERSGMIWVK